MVKKTFKKVLNLLATICFFVLVPACFGGLETGMSEIAETLFKRLMFTAIGTACAMAEQAVNDNV